MLNCLVFKLNTIQTKTVITRTELLPVTAVVMTMRMSFHLFVTNATKFSELWRGLQNICKQGFTVHLQ